MQVDYEKYKRLCENFVDQATGNKLPIRLSEQEQQEAIKAFEQLAYKE